MPALQLIRETGQSVFVAPNFLLQLELYKSINYQNSQKLEYFARS